MPVRDDKPARPTALLHLGALALTSLGLLVSCGGFLLGSGGAGGAGIATAALAQFYILQLASQSAQVGLLSTGDRRSLLLERRLRLLRSQAIGESAASLGLSRVVAIRVWQFSIAMAAVPLVAIMVFSPSA